MDVVISADALIGDNDWTPESKRLGPIGSQIARDLCTSPDARWRRLVTDRSPANSPPWQPSNTASPTTSATPSKPATSPADSPAATPRRILRLRPHHRPPTGATCPDSLAGLCRRHHRKTFTAWKPDATPTPHPRPHLDQPLGRTHRTTAHRYKQDE